MVKILCPICGGAQVSRERRINGNDVCINGHTYPSKKAVVIYGDVKDTSDAADAADDIAVNYTELSISEKINYRVWKVRKKKIPIIDECFRFALIRHAMGVCQGNGDDEYLVELCAEAIISFMQNNVPNKY